MNVKRIVAVGAVCALLTGALTVGASAHGHGRGARRASYPACTVESCTSTGNHTHSGVNYCGHAAASTSGHHGGGRHC